MIRLNRRGIGSILRGQEGRMRQDLRARGQRIAQAAGPGHEVEEFVGRTRVRVTVRTTNPVKPSGMEALRRAFGAGR